MAVKTFSVGELATSADVNTYLANAGLVYIDGGTQSGTAALTKDGVFTNTYLNYRLVMTGIECSVANNALQLKFRASGSTNSATSYGYAYRGLRETGAAADTALQSATFAEIGVYIGAYANLKIGSCSIDINAPQASETTFGLVNAIGYEGGGYQMRNGGFVFNDSTSFDGFRIGLSGSGNIAFKWRLYGYRQA